MHHLVEVSHKSSQQERDITMKTKDEYLRQLQDRLLQQQAENDEERTRLQNLVAKMEVQIREHSRKFEEDKWKLSQVILFVFLEPVVQSWTEVVEVF